MDDGKLDALGQTIVGALGGAATGHSVAFNQLTIDVKAEKIVEVAKYLRDDQACRFINFTDVTAVNYPGREKRFDVVYHLLSVPNRLRLRLKVRTSVGGSIPTVQGIWKSAGWLERETWDMFGIVFDGHPDLRRLLMPEDWDGHPARKDYPVQIRKAAQTYEPLEVTEDEFKANIERDRLKRAH
mgnify:CR=1 FL=1